MSELSTKPAEGATTTNQVSKDEFDKLAESKKELEAKLDEAKLSLLDPEYISFLESKKSAKAMAKADKAVSAISDKDIERLSQREFLDLAVIRAKEALLTEVLPKYEEKIRHQDATISDVLAVLELQDVEKRYPDFQTFRDDTRKILESSQTPLTIEQAYKLAKYGTLERTASAPATPPSTEKPSVSLPSETLQQSKFKSKAEAAEDAWNKIVGPGRETL